MSRRCTHTSRGAVPRSVRSSAPTGVLPWPHLQLAVDGHAGGVAVGTVGQAEAFVDAGHMGRVAHRQGGDRTDRSRRSVRWPAARPCHSGSTARTTLPKSPRPPPQGALGSVSWWNSDTGLGLTGVPPGDAVIGLARKISGLPGVQLKGLTSYSGPSPEAGDGRAALEQVLGAREAMAAAGLPAETVAVGSTADYEAAGRTEGVTEVVAGTYALGDVRYEGIRGDIEPAAMVLGTVVSTPRGGRGGG